jgi:hypothetical protein
MDTTGSLLPVCLAVFVYGITVRLEERKNNSGREKEVEITILHSFSDANAGCLNLLAEPEAVLAIASAHLSISNPDDPAESSAPY